jgi:hypothetical protein
MLSIQSMTSLFAHASMPISGGEEKCEQHLPSSQYQATL